MPALRNIPVGMGMAPRTRRRSSVFAPAKAGVYGVQNPSSHNHGTSHLPPRPISFAPNVTPVTFNESSDSSSPSTPEPGSPSALPKLFPPSETPAPPPARKRCPPGKRRSQGYIPRPPNAFMLFRADFVRQKHVPGSIETNHGSLSKIIGNCWRSLPLDEKKVWETRAKHEKAAHKIAYPNYRFRPVHNKNKKKDGGEVAPSTTSNGANGANGKGVKGGDKKDKHEQTFEEEIRCEEVTQLLLEGKKGEELAQALRDLEKRRLVHHSHSQSHSQSTHGLYLSNTQDYRRSETPSTASSIPFGGIMSAPQPTYPSPMLFGGPNATPLYMHRRSSSVPLPNNHFPNYAGNANAFDWSSGVGGDYMMDAPPPPYEFEAASQDQDLGGSNISIPSVPFLPPPSSGGLAASAHANGPRFSISQQQRMMLGHRRSSSAGAAFGGLHAQQRGWDAPMSFGGGFDGAGFAWPGQQAQGNGGEMVLQRDDSALPEADLSLFNPSFLSGHSDLHSQSVGPMDALVENVDAGSVGGGNGSVGVGEGVGVGGSAGATPNGCFSVSDLYQGLPPQALGPLDIGPDAMAYQQEQAHHHHQQSQDLHLQQQHDLHVQQQQQQQQQWDQQQQNDGGLQLEFANVEAEAEAAQYEQMYLAEQHAQYLMGGYDVATAGGEGQYEGGMGYEYGAGQYVEC